MSISIHAPYNGSDIKEIQIFANDQFGEVRTLNKDGEPWFVGKDVAEILGYGNTKDALLNHVDEEDRAILQKSENATFEIPNRGMTIINESGLYSLVLSSKLPAAKAFKRWITHDVIPSIRKTGGYIARQENMTAEELMAKALLVAKKTIEEKETQLSQTTAELSKVSVQNAIMQPKSDYFDELVERNTLTNFRETANQLGIGQKTLVNFLLDRKFIYRDKKGKIMPYADKNDGLFTVKECFNEKTQWAGTQTLITPKGRETFRLLCQGL